MECLEEGFPSEGTAVRKVREVLAKQLEQIEQSGGPFPESLGDKSITEGLPCANQAVHRVALNLLGLYGTSDSLLR